MQISKENKPLLESLLTVPDTIIEDYKAMVEEAILADPNTTPKGKLVKGGPVTALLKKLKADVKQATKTR